MGRKRANAGVKPWPSAWTCDDGQVRNLARYRPAEWLDHPEVQAGAYGYPPGDDRAAMAVFNAERIRAARSVGRDPVGIVSAMAGRKWPL